MLEGYTDGDNFPWLLGPDTWWPLRGIDDFDLLRGVIYYWWMRVLTATLWMRARRKWCVLIALALTPEITAMSHRFAYLLADAAW